MKREGYLWAVVTPMLLGIGCSDHSDHASQPSEPLGQAPQALGTASQSHKLPDKVASELLVKFKDDAAVGAVADQLIDSKQPFSDIAPGSRLDALNAKYGVTRAKNVLSPDRAVRRLSGRLDRARARTLNEQDQTQYRQRFATRFKGKAPRGAASTSPPTYLGNLYRVDFGRRDVDPARAAAEFAADSSVEYAVPNYIRRMEWIPNDPRYPEQWAHEHTAIESGWDVQRGSSDVVIAVIDSGVDYNHEDLSANIWHDASGAPGRDFVDIDTAQWVADGFGLIGGEDYEDVDAEPMDFGGHGTHCAGIAAAVADNSLGVAGIANRARLMPVRAGFSIDHPWYGEVGLLNDATIVPALHYAVDNGADVISMSFGSQADSPAIRDAIHYAAAAGVTLIASAGNSNTSARFFPAGYGEVIAVGATNNEDARASYSNFGTWVDIAAPGGERNANNKFSPDVSILSTVPKSGGMLTDASGYAAAAGTSMAGPYAAGVAALLVAQYPSASRDELRGRLLATADPVAGDAGSRLGSGRVNVQRALTEEPVPFLRLQQFDLHEVTGNKNRIPEPGETASIMVTLENVWASLSGASVTLSSPSSAVTVTQSQLNLGSMATAQSLDNRASPFLVQIGQASRDTSVPLTLTADIVTSDGTHRTQSLEFEIPLGIARVTSSNDVVFSPVVGGHTAVFSRIDWDDNQVNLYAVDLKTGHEKRVTQAPEYSISTLTLPGDYVVSDTTVAYTDNRSGNLDVYAYDLARDTESVVCDAEGRQGRLDLSGNILVWEDERSGNADIYSYDLVTHQPTAVATGALSERWPQVSGKKVVYSAVNGDLDEDIYLTDLATGQTSLVVSAPTIQRPIDLSNNRLLYVTGPSIDPDDPRQLVGAATFAVRDLGTGQDTEVRTIPDVQYGTLFPSLSGSNVVWRNEGSNIDVFVHSLETGTTTQLTTHPAAQYEPSIWGNRVVWSDNREGNAVYWTELGPELGDANWDSTVDIVDALIVSQHYVGTPVTRFFAEAADVNCDGSADIIDALLIAQRYVGTISRFPCDPD